MVRELQKSFGNKKATQQIPDCLEGKVNPGEILEQFREGYKELYNSICTVEEMSLIKLHIADLLPSEPAAEASKITSSVVKIACSKMKAGKKDVSGSYSSDALID